MKSEKKVRCFNSRKACQTAFAVLKEEFQHQRMSDSYISCLLLTLESVFTCLLVAHPGLFILGNKYRDCFCREVNNQFYVFFSSLKSNQSITQVAKRNLSNTAAIFIGCKLTKAVFDRVGCDKKRTMMADMLDELKYQLRMTGFSSGNHLLIDEKQPSSFLSNAFRDREMCSHLL